MQRREGEREMGLRPPRVWVAGERLLQQHDRIRETAYLIADKAQTVQRIDMVRCDAQHHLVELRGFGQSPLPVQRGRLPEYLASRNAAPRREPVFALGGAGRFRFNRHWAAPDRLGQLKTA